jgi:hypothetical protein
LRITAHLNVAIPALRRSEDLRVRSYSLAPRNRFVAAIEIGSAADCGTRHLTRRNSGLAAHRGPIITDAKR